MKNCYVQKKTAFTIIALVTMMATFTSCRNDQQTSAEQNVEDEKEDRYWNLIYEVYECGMAKDEHLLPVIDSLEAAGELSSARADFARGTYYDFAGHIKAGERFYAKAYETAKLEKESWRFYSGVSDRLSQIRMMMGDHAGSIAVATDYIERAEKAGQLDPGTKSGFLWSIAVCQANLGLDEAEQSLKDVYELLEKQAKEEGDEASANLLIFTCIIIEVKVEKGDYAEAETWVKKAEDILKRYYSQSGDSAITREYTGILTMEKVSLLEGQNKGEQAYAFFRKSLPFIVNIPRCTSRAANYLLEKKKYTEAADLYNHIDATTPADNRESEINLDNIGTHDIARLKANLGAGRTDSVVSIARRIAENYDKALDKERKGNATEMAIIYSTQQKDAEIAQQQLMLSRQRSIGTLAALVLLTAFFIIYTWYRRRAANRLGTALVQLQNAHFDLKKAYGQLEETTAAKERIESELRIARDIQMSMVPGMFPEYEGLDMYAEMNPAKEVGGDLYGYVMQGDVLYFCVGDVSGKGVPASLFMAQSARLFRTLATEGMMPADIAARMNNELAENNDRGMFVTMFIGLLHLDTGRLDYCNCGHNPPVIDGQFQNMQYDNQPLGLWEDDPFEGETIDDIRGRQLLIYTDGLNEAENQEKELLGNARLLELMADTKSLSSREVIDKLKAAVEQHRAGADPNDDLTLMCITLKQ